MTEPDRPRRIGGLGTVLVWVYGILALAATGRSASQIISRFSEAPVPYLLSALAAVVYILATVALVASSRSSGWYRVAWAAVSFELVGVLIIGALSFVPAVENLFHAEATVWTHFGSGYVWVPLVLPFLGMWWLTSHAPSRSGAEATS
ncbi:hypothetical protein [Microbacterium halotolerans]|uniref:hypothetical protein n=1 Tax=Microbacterium halotolerans TaxID=246613 RepID=UPI000E6AC2ED|nr:hypothetical protein [Microbacterium halotolerans]